MTPSPLLSYASLTPQEVFTKADTQPTGLSPKTHASRLIRYGPNTLEKLESRNSILEFLDNFSNPLVILLIIVAIVSFALGETVNGFIVAIMVLLSAVMNFAQEHQAGRAAEKLLAQVTLKTTVIRQDKTFQLPASQLVPGDVIVLTAGNLIPADARLVETANLFVNQSALTGESFPVAKTSLASPNPEPVEGEGGSSSKDAIENPADSPNLILMGTSVTTGSGRAVIVSTGKETEFGKLAKFISNTRPDNDFTVGIQHFSTFIVRMVIVFVVLIFALNALLKQDIIDSLWFAIAIAVGMTPEFLPMVMSVTMGKGSLVMAKKGVIVKKLTAIPTLGSMNVLCTDKTGTLTNDHIELVKYVNLDGVDTAEVLKLAYVNSCLQTGIQNPMDEAVKSFHQLPISAFQKLGEIPYDFDRKRMSVIVKHQASTLLITKGAPESILEVATKVDHHGKFMAISPLLKKQYIAQYEDLSRQGFRVLALATKALKTAGPAFTVKDETGLVIRGLIAFFDSVKPAIRQSLDALEDMGIEVKVITGDNELVTKRVCSLAGIDVKAMLLGHQIDSLSDSRLAEIAKDTTIFARFSPAQKNRVILALKKNQSVVGYLGDGINDTPSLRSADLGISVSNAVDVAKEAADFILTHKSLSVLAQGVTEGRKTFGNTMKYVIMSLSSNFGNMFSILGAVLFLPYLPMLPLQILLNNFLYDISQLTLPSDLVDDEYIRTPKRWNIGAIRRFMFAIGPISSIFDFACFYLLYRLFPANPAAFQTGWFIMTIATQALVIHIIRTRHIPFFQSRASLPLFITTIGIVILGWSLPFSGIGSYFGFVPLPPFVLLAIAGLVILYLFTTEVGKRAYYRAISPK